jgi:uncharacterized membrane protein
MLKPIAAIVGTLLAMDAVWLSSTAASTRAIFAKLQGQPLEIRWIPAIAVYAIMVLAVWFFAVEPSKTMTEAGTKGAVLGFTMYGLYDLTNYATLTKYPLSFALTDMTWGTVLMATAAAVGFWFR